MDVVPQIPVVHEKPGAVTYGPLAETPVDPDVVFLRAQRQAAHGAVRRDPGPAHRGQAAVPHRRDRQGRGRARGERRAARSAACAPACPPTEMTCAIPASKLAEIVDVDRSATRSPTPPSRTTPPTTPAASPDRAERCGRATSWRPRSRGSSPDAWSVTSTTSVISGTESRIATSMPWLSVTAAMPQPWQPPRQAQVRDRVLDRDQLGVAAVRRRSRG